MPPMRWAIPGLGRLSINARKFAAELKKREVKATVQDFLQGVGDDNVLYCCSRGKPLFSFLPPERQAELGSLAAANPWLAQVITEKDLLSSVPPDLMARILSYPQGEQWIREQMADLRRLMGVSS